MQPAAAIPGYTLGSSAVSKSPVRMDDLRLLQETVLFTEQDAQALRQAGQVLESQIDDILDLWYGFVGSHPHLLEYFKGADDKPDAAYLQAVRARFAQWIRDTCRADYSQPWLDYQQEIALRHTSAKKNRTDGVAAKTAHIPLRYMVAFVYPITATIKPFLAKRGHSAEEVEKMYQAWFKSVVLQVALWSVPYARDGAW